MEKKAPKTILVADDDLSISTMLPRMIAHLGYAHIDEIATAANGEDALKIAKKHPTIELLISDTDMPIKDGYAALKEFKALYPYAKTIQMTGGDYNKKSEHADSFMAKPFDLDTIDKVVGKYLTKNK